MNEPARSRPAPAADSSGAPQQASMADYLREAFFFRWNLLTFGFGAAAAVMTPLAPESSGPPVARSG